MEIDKETTDIIVNTYRTIKELQNFLEEDFSERIRDFIQSGNILNSMMNDLFNDKLNLKEQSRLISEMFSLIESTKIYGYELKEEGFEIKTEIFNKLDEIHAQLLSFQKKANLI